MWMRRVIYVGVSVAAVLVVPLLAHGAVASFAKLDQQARAGQPLSVVFFGGSLTWGANARNPQINSYRGLMEQFLRRHYPHAPFTFHDAAIGGTGSKLGLFRLQCDVLAYRPDLVFLEFTANDNLGGTDMQTLGSYERLLRALIKRGIPVEQVFLGFEGNFGKGWNPARWPRLTAHLRLAAAYHTAVGNTFPLVQHALTSGAFTIHQLWPLDGVHPGDTGYRLFYEAVRKGFLQAVQDKRICVVPPHTVFPALYRRRERIRLAKHPLPPGWQVVRTYRTSMWFDGLSSRWMGDVTMCDVKDKAVIKPLQVKFSGTLLGLFGEGDGNSLSFTATVDGQPMLHRVGRVASPVWSWNTRRMSGGRLFRWRILSDTLPPGRHTLIIKPVFPHGQTRGQLRIESVCAAGN